MYFQFEPGHRMSADDIRAGITILLGVSPTHIVGWKQDEVESTTMRQIRACRWGLTKTTAQYCVELETFKDGLTRVFIDDPKKWTSLVKVLTVWAKDE